MPLTDVDLCNEALDLVGASPIQSFTDGTIEADICARLYPNVRDRVLREYPCNCAQTRSTLPLFLSDPAWAFSYAYELPKTPDYCLRVLSIAQSDEAWRVEQLRVGGQIRRLLLCNVAAPLPILYIRRIDEPDHMDPLLYALISAELAIGLAAKLTESASRIGRINERAIELRKRAMLVDAQEAGQSQMRFDATSTYPQFSGI